MSITNKIEENYVSSDKNFLVFSLFLTVITVAVIQDLPLIVWALFEGLPTSPQKYVKFDDISHFYCIKVVKYVLFSITLCLVLHEINRDNLLRKVSFLVFTIVTVVTLPSLIVWGQSTSVLLFLAGGKAWLPIGAIFCGFLLVNSLKRLETTFYCLLLLNLIIAVVQLVHGIINFQNHEIVNLPQIEWKHLTTIYRSTGTFAESNTLGLFAVSVILLSAIYERVSWIFLTICFLLLILSGSRTAQLAALLPLLYIFYNDPIPLRVKVYILVCISLSIIYMLWARGFQSFVERYSILLESFNIKNILFGNGFGIGTLGSYNFMNYFKDMSIPNINTDSMYTSLQVQGGIWMNLFFWGSLCFPLLIFPKQRLKILILLVTFIMVSCGLVALEVWPFNIIWFAIYGALIRQGLLQTS